MRRNISTNIVSIGSMRIAEDKGGGQGGASSDGGEAGGRRRSRVVVERTLPSFRGRRSRGESRLLL